MSRPPGRPGLCSLVSAWRNVSLKPILRILSISWPNRPVGKGLLVPRGGDHLTGAPIFQAAGLNMGNGMLVLSDGLFDSGGLGCDTGGAGAGGGNWGAGVGRDSVFGAGAGRVWGAFLGGLACITPRQAAPSVAAGATNL
jgi:hypothetical protein